MITNENIEGATPLDPDEMAGLKLKHITTRGELDELEQANIVQGMLWIKKHNRQNILSIDFICKLHKALFGQVWAWAGSFRKTEKNIGIDPLHITVNLRNLVDDAGAWIEFKSFPSYEAILRLHHQLVKIHPFPNGNGRFSRIYADLVAEVYFGLDPIEWGGTSLDSMTETRKNYIQALRKADLGDYRLLMDLYCKD